MSDSTVNVVVSAIIENLKGEILLVKRSPHKIYPDLWEDVGGGVEDKEKPEQAILREIAEETGITNIEFIKPLTLFHFFHGGKKNSENEIVGITYWCKTQNDQITLSDEHTEFKWVMPEEALSFPIHEALKKILRELYTQKEIPNEKINSIDSR